MYNFLFTSSPMFKRTAVAVAMSFTVAANADAIVYTSSNAAEANEIIAFDIDKDGDLFEIGRFPTGGEGSGAPLGNQSAIATDASDRWMFVTNAGDGSVTSLRLQENGLEFVSKVDSGGFRPISVTVFGTLVYVLNEGSGDALDPPARRYDNITGFRFNNVGELVRIGGSRRILDRTQLTAPAQVGFNKSGTVLLVTEKATNTIRTWTVRRSGRPSRESLARPSAVPTPFGFAFGDRDYVFITEANGGDQGVTASYRVDRATGAVSSLVGIVEQEGATCWTVLNSDQTLGYSVNTAGDSISIYDINFNGTLEPFFANPNRSVATGDAPRDAALSQDNRYLFVLNNGEGTLGLFDVRRSGRLRDGDTAPIPTSATGVIAR